MGRVEGGYGRHEHFQKVNREGHSERTLVLALWALPSGSHFPLLQEQCWAASWNLPPLPPQTVWPQDGSASFPQPQREALPSGCSVVWNSGTQVETSGKRCFLSCWTWICGHEGLEFTGPLLSWEGWKQNHVEWTGERTREARGIGEVLNLQIQLYKNFFLFSKNCSWFTMLC